MPSEFLEFIHSTFRNAEVSEWMLDFLGYCLTGENSWQGFSLWVGEGGTGKSQLMKLIRRLLGRFCGDIDADSLVPSKHRSAATDSDLASIAGCRMVFCPELIKNQQLDEHVVKAITGEDPIKVKFMGENKFDMHADAKIVFTANERPQLSNDSGIARRYNEIRFNHKPERIVPKLAEHLLRTQGPMILGYLAKRAAKYYSNPGVLELPGTIAKWTEEGKLDFDMVQRWHDDCTVYNTFSQVATEDLYNNFKQYSELNMVGCDTTKMQFAKQLTKFGFVPHSDGKFRGWKNVMLR